MDGRDTSPLGIPKSPSFHSGLDLVASSSSSSASNCVVGGFLPLMDLQTPPMVVVDNSEKNPFVAEAAGGGGGGANSYLHNFTLTLRKDKSPNGGGGGSGGGGIGKNDLFYCEGGALRKDNENEKAVQMQGHLPRLAGICLIFSITSLNFFVKTFSCTCLPSIFYICYVFKLHGNYFICYSSCK